MSLDQETIARNRRTKDSISFSLFRLLLKKEYPDVSITEICEMSKVSRTTFYRYYRDKRDILVDFTNERFEEFFENISKKYKEVALKHIFFEIMSIVYNYRLQIIKLIESGLQDLLLDQFTHYFRYLFRQTSLKTDVLELSYINSPHFVYGAAFFAGGVYSTVLRWAERNMEETPEKLTQDLIDVFEAISGMDQNKPIIFY